MVRESASGVVGPGWRPGGAIPKAIKMVLVAPLLSDTHYKRVMPGRYKEAVKYRSVMEDICYVTVKALLSLCCLFQTQFKIMLLYLNPVNQHKKNVKSNSTMFSLEKKTTFVLFPFLYFQKKRS